MYTVDNYPGQFNTRRDAESYAKSASIMFGESVIVVRFNGTAIAKYSQGRKQSALLARLDKYTATV